MSYEKTSVDSQTKEIESLKMNLNVHRFIVRVLPIFSGVLIVLSFLAGGALL